MKRLCKYMKDYTNTLSCKVLFLDANVPGEGEHKIIRFINLVSNMVLWINLKKSPDQMPGILLVSV